MSTPSYEEVLQGATTWKFQHGGVSYLLSHHGYRVGNEYELATPHPGTWCYYIIVPEQMYPHRWADFACTRDDNGYQQPGPAWDHDWFDSGITWSSSEPYFDRQTRRMYDAAKVGCDYAHLWHMERGYPDTFQSVKADAIHTIENLIVAHPDRLLRSNWSGLWDEAARFYEAVNGSLVHETDQIDPKWTGWRRGVPATEAAS